MHPLSTKAVAALCATIPNLLAQNVLQHHDGNNEATSRGVGGVAPKTLLQRIPDNQACGRTALSGVTVVIQDQDIATPEMFVIEIRTAVPPLGAPDMTPAGLIAAVGPIFPVFPPPGPISAVAMFIPFVPPIPLPPSGAGIASDIHVGIAFPPAPAFPIDGISVHCSGSFFVPLSVGEQMSPVAVGYVGLPGVAGLAWDFNAATLALGVAGGNRAIDIAPEFVDGVCQPFAINPAVFTGIPYAGVAGTGTGLDPNFGYAGLFPMLARGDVPAWRVRASTSVGSPAMLYVGPATMPPLSLPFLFTGSLCVDLASAIMVPMGLTVAGAAPPGTSEAMLALPLAGAPAGIAVYAQGVTFDPVTLTITVTTMCRTVL